MRSEHHASFNWAPRCWAAKTHCTAWQCHREIVLPNRSLVVCCDQEEILKKWVDAINAHIRYERKTEHLKKIQM